MEENKEFLLTQEGYDKLEEELENLKVVKRKEVAERIKVAISFGDLSENAEYDEAKKEQAQVEERILKLENMVRKAVIIDEEVEYTIVGSTEADPYDGKISNESPVGKALLGRAAKEVVEVQVPDGVAKFEILEIRR